MLVLNATDIAICICTYMGFVREAFGLQILYGQISARRIVRQKNMNDIVKQQQQSSFVSVSDGNTWRSCCL